MNGWIGGGSHFRCQIELDRLPGEARIRISALGYFILLVNGRRVGDDELVPAQSNYEKVIFFLEYDLTPHLLPGVNSVEAVVGEGFWGQSRVTGRYGWTTPYGERGLWTEFDLDGVRHTPAWQAADGRWLSDNVYAGETYDARRPLQWRDAAAISPEIGELTLQPIPPERVIRTFGPVSVNRLSNGVRVYDFGENISGWCEIRVSGNPGDAVTLRYGEELNEDGSVDFASTGEFATHCIPTDRYICAGTGCAEAWHPSFGYRGFRYVEASGDAEFELTACEVRSDLERTGGFECSDALLNDVFAMAVRTLNANLHSLPTDCPIREKCGWLGDAQVIAEWASWYYEMEAFWGKYLDDIDTSRVDGLPTMIAPGRRTCGTATPAWGVAVAVLPDVLKRFYGTTPAHREMLERWVRHLAEQSEDHIVSHGLGDWCPPGSVNPHTTPVALTSTAMFFQSAQLAGAGELAEAVRRSFHQRFFKPEAASYGSQTADALALGLGLCPVEWAERVAASLHADLASRDYHFTTGILGLRHLFEVLARYGYIDAALKVFHAPGYPGFRELLRQGATTLWETWEKHPVDEPTPRSRSHPMQSAFAGFFFRTLGGLVFGEEFGSGGVFTYEPYIPTGLEYCRVSYQSRFGLIESEWRQDKGRKFIRLTLPTECRAEFVRNYTTAEAEFSLSRR